jgi:hypothetical protein
MRALTIPIMMTAMFLLGCPGGEKTEQPDKSEKSAAKQTAKESSKKSDETQPAKAVEPSIGGMSYVKADGDDKVGKLVAPGTDGQPDHVFKATVQGDIHALILTVCTGGKHSISQWDTLATKDPAPPAFHWKDGTATWLLGVEDAEGKSLNAADGRLSKTSFADAAPLSLFAADNGFLTKGAKLCLTALGHDGKVVAESSTTL